MHRRSTYLFITVAGSLLILQLSTCQPELEIGDPCDPSRTGEENGCPEYSECALKEDARGNYLGFTCRCLPGFGESKDGAGETCLRLPSFGESCKFNDSVPVWCDESGSLLCVRNNLTSDPQHENTGICNCNLDDTFWSTKAKSCIPKDCNARTGWREEIAFPVMDPDKPSNTCFVKLVRKLNRKYFEQRLLECPPNSSLHIYSEGYTYCDCDINFTRSPDEERSAVFRWV